MPESRKPKPSGFFVSPGTITELIFRTGTNSEVLRNYAALLKDARLIFHDLMEIQPEQSGVELIYRHFQG